MPHRGLAFAPAKGWSRVCSDAVRHQGRHKRHTARGKSATGEASCEATKSLLMHATNCCSVRQVLHFIALGFTLHAFFCCLLDSFPSQQNLCCKVFCYNKVDEHLFAMCLVVTNVNFRMKGGGEVVWHLEGLLASLLASPNPGQSCNHSLFNKHKL
eukprot:1160179-Pelagomonas_calceolata.AAC.17